MRYTRRILQGAFLAVVLATVFIFGGDAEAWCPFGGVEAIYTYITEGSMTCSLGVSNFYALGGVLLSVLLLRRAFCGYLCPIGTISEWIGILGAKLGLRPLTVPPLLDHVLSLLKYAVLATILWFTWQVGELLFRGYDPCYALISRHGEDITVWAYVVAGGIVVGSLLVSLPFCRWLCPMAAVMNPLSRLGLTRIKRDKETCIDCGKCSQACPMAIPVHKLDQVNVARCTSCMSCIQACPVADKGALTWGPPKALGGSWPQAAPAAALLVVIVAVAAAAYTWPLASFVKEHRADQTPTAAKTLELRVKGIDCRGSSQLFSFFVFRDDISEVPGYLKVETWPAHDIARIRITYDADLTDAEAIKEAITEPYYDEFSGNRDSPFEIEGYSPWGATDDDDGG